MKLLNISDNVGLQYVARWSTPITRRCLEIGHPEGKYLGSVRCRQNSAWQVCYVAINEYCVELFKEY